MLRSISGPWLMWMWRIKPLAVKLSSSPAPSYLCPGAHRRCHSRASPRRIFVLIFFFLSHGTQFSLAIIGTDNNVEQVVNAFARTTYCRYLGNTRTVRSTCGSSVRVAAACCRASYMFNATTTAMFISISWVVEVEITFQVACIHHVDNHIGCFR